MNNSYRIQQRHFLKNYGPVLDFDDLGNAVVAFVDDRARAEIIDGQLTDNYLIGLHWTVDYTCVAYAGHSINTRESIMRQSTERDTIGYAGRMWVRFARDIFRSPDQYFVGSMFHLGAGGYSTWEGPWNEYGKQISELEQGVPVGHRRPFGTYSFSCQFYLSDFPDIDQYAIMKKLEDDAMPERHVFGWDIDGIEQEDQVYIDFLKDYREKMLDTN